MRCSGLSACAAVLLILLPGGTPGSEVMGAVDEGDAVVVEYSAGRESWQAIALRDTAPGKPTIRRHLLIVDTSASQVGYVRSAALKLVDDIANHLPAGNQVQLAVVDSLCQPLTDGFVSPQSAEFSQARRRLSSRTPLGATNLRLALDHVLSVAGGQPMSVCFIGDGVTALHVLTKEEIREVTDRMAASRVSVHWIVTGPIASSVVPSALAGRTGGTVVSLESELPDGRAVVASLQIQPTRIESVSAGGQEIPVINECSWLRPDVHTVLFSGDRHVAKEPLTATLADGRTVTWKAAVSRPGGAEVRVLSERFAETGGVVHPAASLQLLGKAADEFQTLMDRSVRVARRLQRMGREGASLAVIRQAAALDPQNDEVAAVLTSLDSSETAGGDDSADDRLTEDDVIDGSLEDVSARLRRRTQKMVHTTETTIDEARRYAAEQPEYAESLLKDLLATVEATTDIADDVRVQLRARIASAIGQVQRRREEREAVRERQAVRRAVEEAQANLLAEEARQEKDLQTIIDQVRGLLYRASQGDTNSYEDAETAARIAIELKPGNGPATQALMMAEASGQLDKARRLRELRADRFLEALYQVELSHVPFPDEPPVQYPPTDVWRALTLTRKPKYSSLSLQSQSKTEEWLNRMLSEPIPLLDYPGEASLDEILSFLADYYTETWGSVGGGTGSDYRMTIWPDFQILSEEAIDSLEDVTVQDIVLEGITLKTALKLIFERTDPELTYIIQDDVVKITTAEVANSDEYLDTRIYPVGDLVIPATPPAGGAGGFGRGGAGGAFGGAGGAFGGAGGGFGGIGGGAFSVPPEWNALLEAGEGGITNAVLKKKRTR